MNQLENARTVYEGHIFDVVSGRVRGPDGEASTYDVVTHPGGAAVVPFDGEAVILVRQPRPAVGETLLEIPAGKLEADGDDPEARARAELEEEAGYRAGRLQLVADFYVSPGYTDERLRVYLAFDLEHVGAHPESTEDIELVRLGLPEVRRMLDEHAFRDAKTIIGLRALLDALDEPSNK